MISHSRRLTVPTLVPILVMTLSVFLNGCGVSEVRFSGNESIDAQNTRSSQSGNAESGGNSVSENPLASSCHVESFKQPVSQRYNALDLLFVTDTSQSLEDEREKIAGGIDSFLAELPNEIDFQVGVMLGHGNDFMGKEARLSGRLFQGVLRSSSGMSREEIRNELTQRLTSVPGQRSSDGGELGLFSLQKALSERRLKEIRAEHGFFRPDSLLAIVFIADENDICAQYPKGITPSADANRYTYPNGTKVSVEEYARRNSCEGVSIDAISKRLKEIRGEAPTLFAAITYLDSSKIPRSENGEHEDEVGYGYIDLPQRTGGILIDLGDAAGLSESGSRQFFAEGLSRIGQTARRKLQLITSYTLNSTSAVIEETLEVLIDGKPVQSTLDPATRELHLTGYSGDAGSLIRINYCTK